MLRPSLLAALPLASIALVGCGPGSAELYGPPTAPADSSQTILSNGSGETVLPPDDPGTAEEAPDLRVAGPFPVVVTRQEVQTSCRMSTRIAVPDGIEPAAVVVLAHGFQRSANQVEGWADHWASWGLAVATPELCHASFWDADHEANAQDLAALAEALAPGAPVVYAGHSAGGLAAWLATSLDPDAVGHVGLDLTDSENLALDAAAGLPVPSWGLLAEPDLCNSDGNGEAAYVAAPAVTAVRVVGAGHCDFESPTDWGCETFCSRGSAPDAQVHPAILALSTAAVLGAAGEAPALDWWTPGTEWWQLLADAGAIEAVAP